MIIELRECQRCGHKWFPRKVGVPNNCANKHCGSSAWDKPRPKSAEKKKTYGRIFPELHELNVGQSCNLYFCQKDIGDGDARPIRAVNYERKKYGKKFNVIPSIQFIKVIRTA